MFNEEFDESRIPLAYLITFRSYGTWLHGDERGSVDYSHNVYNTPLLTTDGKREEEERQRLKQAPVKLDEAQRIAADNAIREVCVYRNWILRALNARTNHIHEVVSAPCKPEKVLSDFKAYSTRRMREAGIWRSAHSPWAEKGSRRYLWKPEQVDRACEYVLNHQGDDLIPDFKDDAGKQPDSP
jgi:REP element-mobilizing transposase RayT